MTTGRRLPTLRFFPHRLAVTVALIGFFTASNANAEYRLQPGDVIEFSVAGIPELKQRCAIDIDGSVSFPLAGPLRGAGLSLAEVREKLTAQISSQEFRRRGYVKMERDVIGAQEVMISIAEYRPVYVNGDVAKPGSEAFQPGLTVRQAISLAGGYDSLRFRMDNPFLETAELRGAYNNAWLDYAKEQMHIWRLQSELGDKPQFDEKSLSGLPLPTTLLNGIKEVETRQLALRQSQDQKQHQHLAKLVDQRRASVDALTNRHNAEAQGQQYDENEFKRTEDLYKRGVAPTTRVADERRIMLLSSTQSLQSQVELERAKAEFENAQRDVQQWDEAKRLELLSALRDAKVTAAAVQSRIQAIGEKLVYAGTLKSQLLGGSAAPPQILIIRKGHAPQVGDEDDELMPGDVVEVSLQTEKANVADR
jgi:polysaccharide export outer membrane protein